MGNSKHSIVIEAQVKTTLDGMNEVVNKLQKGLKEGTTKVDLTKGIGAALSKDITKFQKDYERITNLVANGELDLVDSKEFASKAKHIISTFEEIQRVVGNFDSMELIDAKKLFPSAFNSKVRELKATLGSLSESFEKLNSKGFEKQKLENDIRSLESDIEDLKAKAGNIGELKIKSEQAQSDLQKANQVIDEIRNKLKEAYKAKIEVDLPEQEKQLRDKIEDINRRKKKRATTKDIVDREGRVTTYKGKSRAKWEGDTEHSAQQRNAALKILDAYEKEKQELNSLEEQLSKVIKAREALAKTYPKLDNTDLGEASAKLGQGTDEIDAITKALKNQADATEEATRAQSAYNEAQTASSKINSKEADLVKSRTKLAEVIRDIDNLSKKVDFTHIQNAVVELNKGLSEADKIDIDLTPEMLQSEDGVKKLIQALDKLDDKNLEELKRTLREIGLNTEEAKGNMYTFGKAVGEVGESARSLNRAEQDIERLKDQVLDFFSISNTVQIFKDAVRSAFETVKELDAVMTETAVVTEFSVGDMWDKLPEYSDEANKLGTSISSLYEATTLYYQQGLKSQEAMDVGIETMKMARIANMDAAAATEAMTAALRGFNMEINEMSATRINDVYSELAAITAADTSQIATAMSKTASIAASANMEFETTAALLAQIIETTQEAPETAGTAMKTIIARFTEVKQLFDEGMLTGKDSEGEEININKIDAALKKVGISLSDFLRGEKGIDDIFLELASKWDSLDLATQRYIATTAAGSRQQSRFLAMMSNYGRTMELVTAANNSAGASQKQFDKTLESLDAKLQRLKNAWAEFTMGLANNELIKGAVDLLTEILEKLNQFTDFGSDGIGGVVTMLTRLATVIMGLKGGKAIIEGLLKTFVSGKTAFGKQMPEGLGGMGLSKALATEGWIKMGVLDALSEQGAQAEEILDNVKVGFLKAGDGAKLFGKKLLALSPYIAILAAIGAAVYGIVKSFKAAQNEAKLDNINQALTDLNTEAQNAQDELGEIGSARTELDGLQDTLNGLTKGTAEWKSALVDVNRQVLELIEKYPSLEYELGANGALQIKQESWDNLLAQQQKVITNMAAQRLDLESQRANIVKDIDFEKFVVDSYGTNTAETDRKAKRANRQALTSNKDFRKAILQDISNAGAGNVYVEETEQSKVKNQLEEYLVDEQVMGQTKFERWMAQAEMDMAQWYQNSPLLAWLADAANASGNVYIEESETAKRQRLLNENENYYVDEVAEKLVGLNQTEMTALAAEFAREGENSQTVTLSDFQTMLATATGKTWDEKAAQDLLNSIKEFDKATNSFNDLIQTEIENQSSQESLTRQFTMNALTGSSIMEKDYADSIVNIISKGEKEAISDQVDAKASELEASYKDENGEMDLEKLAADYAAAMGFQAVGQEVYRDGTYSDKLDTSPEAMIRALATEAITVEVKEKAEKTAGAIGKEKEQEKLFDNIFSTDGQEITSGQIAKYQNEDGTLKYGQIALDITGIEDFDQMAADMGRDTTELIDILTSNFKTANERIATQRKDLAKRMSKYSSAQGKSLEENAQDLAGLEAKFGDDLSDWIRNSLDSALTSLERTGDEELISEGLEYFRNVAILGTQEEVQELSTLISEIDWSNPIETAHRLNQEIENGSKIAEGFGLAIKQVDSDFLSAQSQFNTLFTTGDYEGLSNKLKEIYDTQGAITDADVRGLASEYSYLNKLMKNTSATGAGLADILTSIQKGELSFDAVTDAVIAAVGRMNSLGEATSKVLQKLRELDMGEDTGEVQDKYREFAEDIEGWQKEGEYGNPQYENTLNYMFGNDWDVGYEEDELIGRMDQLSEIAKKAGEDMYHFWDNASNGLDVYGNKVDENAINKLKEAGVLLDNVNGEVVFDIPDDMTFDEITALLQETFEGSKDLWDDLMVYFENRDPNFRRSWIAADYNSMGDRIVESETTEVGGKKVITQQEIEDMATTQAGKTDKTADKVIEDINKQLEKYEGEIAVIPKLEGLTQEEVTQELDKAFGGTAGSFAEFFKITLDGDNVALDLGAIMSALQGMGLSSEVAAQVANGIAAGAADSVQSIVTTVEGQTVEVPFTTDTIDFVAAMNEAIEQSQKKANENSIEQTASVTMDQSAWNDSVETAKSYLIKNISGTRIPVTAYVSNIEGLPEDTDSDGSENSGHDGKPSFQNFAPKMFSGMAEGTENHSRSELSLTGEEGPELVETKNGAYLTGTEGPQMAYIKRGDTVHTAEETKEIYRRKGIQVPAYKGGNMKPVSSGGKSSDDDEETWENPFDKLYNLLRKIDEELHQRERIERRYEKLLEDIGVSANKIVAVSREELAHLEQERKLQERKISGRNYQIDEYQKENSDLQQYARFVENDRGEKVLRIDWDLIDQVTDTEKGERIEEYVSQLEEWDDDLQEAEEALWDIEDTVAEIKERGKDQYEELEDKIKEAIVQSYQDQIDKLSDINDSINDTNVELLDAIQSSIDKQRQDRDNQRTEDELAEKQRRLLYLQQDTSGANALEILRLQDEIEQGREDYTDTLIDQKISELQKQNDEASKQREKQITLLQAQLDHYIDSGEIWNEVYSLMESGLDENNGLIRGSRLEQILRNSDNFDGLSAIGQQEWWREFNTMVAEALAYLELGRQLEDLGIANQEIEMVLPDGSIMKGTINDQGNVTTDDGQIYNNVYQGADGRYYAGENIQEPQEPTVEHPNDGGVSTPESEETSKNSTIKKNIKNSFNIRRGASMSASKIGALPKGTEIEIDGYKADWYHIINPLEGFIHTNAVTSSVDKTKLKAYKTGGLADFTGPAWLDGTKSRPEIVLNQQDSRNFVQLRDILSAVLSRGNIHTATENNGDILYDIDINVESIGSDYDVEQVANKVKSLINEDARYRNNNTVSLKR